MRGWRRDSGRRWNHRRFGFYRWECHYRWICSGNPWGRRRQEFRYRWYEGTFRPYQGRCDQSAGRELLGQDDCLGRRCKPPEDSEWNRFDDIVGCVHSGILDCLHYLETVCRLFQYGDYHCSFLFFVRLPDSYDHRRSAFCYRYCRNGPCFACQRDYKIR